MNEFLFGVFKILIFLLVVLGMLFGFQLLTRPGYVVERIFPKEKPKASLFFSKKTEDSDRVVVYYFARLFAVCLIAFLAIVIWRSLTNSH